MWRGWLLRQVCLIDLICELVCLLLLIYIPPCHGTNVLLPRCSLHIFGSYADFVVCSLQRSKNVRLNPLAMLDPGIVNPGSVEPAALI